MVFSRTAFSGTKALIVLLGLIGLEGDSANSLSRVSIEFSGTGLRSIRYRDVSFLAFGDVHVRQAIFQSAKGPVAGGTIARVSVDSSRSRSVSQFSWGSVETAYKTAADRLYVSLKITNTSPDTLTDLWVEPLGIQFPSKLREYDGVNPLLTDSNGQPALVQVHYDSGTLVIASEDLDKSVQIGFPWALDGTQTSFPLSVNTGRVSSFPNGKPTIHRPIASHRSEVFDFSIRFGEPEATLDALADDIYRKFTAALPQVLHWKDHRAIGALFLSTAAAGWKNNPRGWLQDPKVDITTPEGIAALRVKVLAYADNSIAILKTMDAQGMITWDIEGQEFPHAISYVCDPRVFDTLAGEMKGIADDYFKRFRDAGLRVGVCIRPQQFELSSDRQKAAQVSVDDPLPLLEAKVRYAKDRWGASIFYVDSNVNAYDLSPIDADIFRKLSAAFPESLFVPEHATLAYYGYVAPYRELRQNKPSTPQSVRSVYPDAFSIVNTSDGPMDKLYDAVLDGVEHGDILLFRAFFDDPQNVKDREIYREAQRHAQREAQRHESPHPASPAH